MGFIDTTYTSGVIAAREKYLLKEKIKRLCELNAEDAFRLLLESGFGGGAETATNVYDYEKLIAAEERATDAFIREYAPSATERAYLLSPRDFHNTKALIKAAYLQTDAGGMLAPYGLIETEKISACVERGDFTSLNTLNPYLGRASADATALLQENASGSKIGEIFEKAQYEYLYEVSKKRSVLKKLLTAKTDMTNILIALRCGDKDLAKEKYFSGGSLTEKALDNLFLEDSEKAEKCFFKTPYAEFVKLCFEAKGKESPFTQAEKLLSGFDVNFFEKRKYELERSEPFLYYVYRRRTENANVRIVFACLLAGQSEHDIKKRLRAL